MLGRRKGFVTLTRSKAAKALRWHMFKRRRSPSRSYYYVSGGTASMGFPIEI